MCLRCTHFTLYLGVKCPSTDNSSCIIRCEGSYTCMYMIIEANQANYIDQFSLWCGKREGVGGQQYDVCDYGWILLDAINIIDFNIFMYDYNDGNVNIDYGSSITNINSFNYQCISSCADLSVFPFKENGITITDADIVCNNCGPNSYFNFLIKNSLSMDCSGKDSIACTGDYYISLLSDKADGVTITCSDTTNTYDFYSIGSCTGYFDISTITDSNSNDNNVSIECGYRGACGSGVFNFTNMNTINMDCYELTSCIRTTIVADTSSQLNLICNETSACKESNVYCPSGDENVCNIDCYLFGHYSVCGEMKIYSQNDYVYEYLNLECAFDPNIDCDDVFNLIFCYEPCGDIMIGCETTFEEYSTGIYYDYDLNTSRCSTGLSQYCCPWERDTYTGAPTSISDRDNTLSPATPPGASPASTPTAPTRWSWSDRSQIWNTFWTECLSLFFMMGVLIW